MKRLRLAQEKSCDEAVIQSKDAAISYADFLLRAAKHTRQSLFRPLALAVVLLRQSALKQRFTNILIPTMKMKPSKRLSASLVTLVSVVCLTLATLGWRTPSFAHEVSDPDLEQKLEDEVLELVELKSVRVKEAIDYLKGPLFNTRREHCASAWSAASAGERSQTAFHARAHDRRAKGGC